MSLTKEDIAKNVSANFRYARKQLGLFQSEMGEKLGLPQKTIGAIEEGRATSVINVYKLSRLINVRMDTIYTTLLNE